MKKIIVIILFLIPCIAQSQTSNLAKVIAREMMRIGTDTSKYFTSTTHTITAASTNREAPTAASVWSMSVKERMHFSASSPSDTNMVWAKTNTSPWKLDSVFSYEFGGWHIAGFYDRISGFLSQKPPLFVVATGQSNMAGIDGGGDTIHDRRVVAWDTTAAVWRIAQIGTEPFAATAANNLAFNFCKKVAQDENRSVRLILMAKASQAISAWFGSGGIAYNINMNAIQAQLPRCDVILWHQGESNHDGAGGCNNNTCYTDSLYNIIEQFRGYSWADETTLFIAGGLFDGAGATQDDRNYSLYGLNTDTIYTTGFAPATGLTDSGDAVHFSGASLVTLGRDRYYNVYRALPQLYFPAGTGGGTAIPTGEIAYGNGTGITSTSTLVYTSSKVGIGVASPAQALHVVGSEHIAGTLRVNAKADSAGVVLRYNSTQSNSSPILRAYNSAGTAMFHVHRTASGNSFFAGNGGLSQSTGSQNTSLGINALPAVSTGVDNVAIGYRAGEVLDGATRNMLIGSLSGLAISSGGSNMLIGYGAGATITTGTQNVAIGTQSMVSVGTGVGQNIAFGTQTGQYFAGNGNIAIGHLAGQNTTSGDENTFIGYIAGRNTTGSGNVQIGANISGTYSESNMLRIENTTATTPLIAGDFSTNYAGVNVAPGSLAAAWHITGTGTTSSTYSLISEKSDGTDVLVARNDGRVGVLVTSPQTTLDVSGGTDGIVMAGGTDAQRPAVNGTLRSNSDNGGIEYRIGNQYYRLVASQTPSVEVGAGAGSGATAVLFDGSNDLAGGVTLTTGTTAIAGTLFTVTFADSFFTGLVIKVTLTPADSDAAAEIAKYYVSSAGITTFVVTAATALTDSTEYKLYYQIGQ